MAPKTKPRTAIQSWRSGLEEKIAGQLMTLGVPFEYETLRIPFVQPSKPRHYTPDFTLLRNGVVVESKGIFESSDRQKHILVREQYPDLDLRLVFSNPNQRISKQSKTTYGAWCAHKGFLFAKVAIPQAWIDEPANERSLSVIRAIKEGSK